MAVALRFIILTVAISYTQAVAVTQATSEELAVAFLHPSMIQAAAMGYDFKYKLQETGNPEAFGTFTAGTFGIETGVVITTGSINSAPDKAASRQGTDFAPAGAAGDRSSLVVEFFFDDVQPVLFQYGFVNDASRQKLILLRQGHHMHGSIGCSVV